MEKMPKFPSAFIVMVQDQARKEASNILKEKDPPRSAFSRETIQMFSYKNELEKFQRTNPTLLAAIVGTISKAKVINY